jgi:D-glycero-beta-D-manno-heptose-7-phosphate kinase
MHSKQHFTDLFSNFSKLRVMIIGDVMVDAYLFGKVDRISPEAPVPVVVVHSRSNRPGGAANVALNIKRLGAEAVLCSVVGKDQKGGEFIDILKENKLAVHGILQSNDRITTTKFRIIGNNSQMLRVDEEITSDLNQREKDLLQFRVEHILREEKIDVIIFQDYNKGVIDEKLIAKTIEIAKHKSIPVVVDPKRKNFLSFKGVHLFKPNLKELYEGINGGFDSFTMENTRVAMQLLQEKIEAEIILVTLSENGVMIRAKKAEGEYENTHIPAHLRSIADVSGAGDTVISAAALCLALKQDPQTLASISNIAGGLVCEAVGVIPIDKNKLQAEVLRLLVSDTNE